MNAGYCIMLAAALSAGNAEFDRTSAESAARISMNRFAAELSRTGPGKGVLYKAMMGDPARFADPAAAEAACRELYMKAARDAFAAERGRIFASLSIDSGLEIEMTDGDRRGIESTFPSAFAAERGDAVAEQARNLVAATRPSEAEFDSRDERDLREEMTRRIIEGQNTPVFAENLAYISENMVEPVMKSAKAERRRQQEYLSRARCEGMAPSRLAAEMEARLRSNVAERSAKTGAAESWGVFPSVVSNALPAAVERRTLERLASRIEDVRLEVSVDDVARVISADPARHVKAADSEKCFATAYSARVLAEGLALAVDAAPEDERAELKDYLTQRLQSETAAKAVDRIVRRDVMPKWRQARAEAARRLAEETWPSLADGTWYPPAALADETAARSDYADALKAWRDIDGLQELAKADGGRPVMEESSALADRRVAAAFDLARNAIAAQNAIVDSCHGEVLAASRAMKESFWTRTPDLKAIAAMLTRAVEERWAARRLDTLWPGGGEPPNAAQQHAELFPSVRRKIELLARVILEEMNDPEPRPENEPKPESDEAVDTSAESPEESAAFTISIVKSGGKIETRLLKGKTPVAERTVDAKLQPFGAAMKELSDRLGRDLLRLE